MKIPTQVRFFIPTAVEALDQTAEPTLEDLSGEDFLGNALADTDQVVNAMDGHPLRPFQVDTDADATVFRIDAEMDQRERVSFLLVDQHNLRDAYPAATKEQIDVHHHSSDAFGSATELTPSKELDGLIGKQRPHLSLDGANDRVSKSNDAQLNFGVQIDFSLECIFKTNTTAQDQYLIDKGSDLGTDKRYRLIYRGPEDIIRAQVDDGTTIKNIDSTTTIGAGERTHVIATFNRDGNGIIYIDDNGAEGTISISSVANIDDTAEPLTIGIKSQDESTSPLEGEVYLARIWNRVLSAAEVLTLYNDSSSIPVADQWARKDILTNSQATSDQQTEANSVASWSASAGAIVSITNAEGFNPKVGTYMLKGSFAVPAQARQSFTTVVGKKYRAWAWLRDTSIVEGAMTLRIGTSAGGTQLGESAAVTANNTWELRSLEFTATGTTTHLSVSKITTGAVNVYADNVWVARLGCVAEYHPSGINEQDGKWYDSSDNNLDGTISGADYRDVPTTTDDFYLAEFTEADDKYWYVRFNADGVTGTGSIDTLVGQIVLGRIYSFNGFKPEGGYSGEYGYPGIITSETDAGNILTERRYGRRPTWDLAFQLSTAAQFEELQEMLDVVQNSLYPFYVCFDYDATQPVIWRVRLQEGLDWSYKHGLDQPYSPTISLIGD